MSSDDDDVLEDEYLPLGENLVEDEVKAKFERNIEDARSVEMQTYSTTKERTDARVAFVNGRVDGWERTTQDGRNFLHVLAYYDYTRRPSLQWLMARAIARLPKLMGEQDSSKRTPLAIAISGGNNMFVHAVCKNVTAASQKQIGEALISECGDRDVERGGTCLHAAIMRGMEPELIKIVIGFAPTAMFSMPDSRGRTPLHLAVEYDRCNAPQVSVVEELLAKGPSALAASMSEQYGSWSVYQHHENTRRERESKDLQKKRSEQGQKRDRLDVDTKRDDRAEKREERISREKAESVSGEHVQKGHDAPPSQVRREKLTIPESIKRLDVMNSTLDSSIGKTQQTAIERDEERKRSSDAIKEKLKLAYLQTRKPQEAMKFLHVQDQRDKELWFDFGPKPKAKITAGEFRKEFGHLDFDSVLQYVAFPRLELDRGNDLPDERYQGRNDMIFFFDWLKTKGVKRIVKVEVDDTEMPCHSDEAIEDALKPFKVEILDWRRHDLCPLTISRIGSNLREINLLWSGRNSVLRSWSEKHGLALTPTLELITIKQIEGLESETRTKSNLDDFEKRLMESWPTDPTGPDKKPSFNRPRSGGGRVWRQGQLTEGIQTAQMPERSVDPHKWMQCMEEFASYFRQIKGITNRVSDPHLHPVMVALIDDGADITHPELRGKKFPGKSFDNYKDGWRVSPYWDSASGHGTLMARLIHRICPSAVIYVIKLKTTETATAAKVQIDPLTAIQAIEHATEIGAQVISMSWTTKPPDNFAERAAFDKAIRDAHTKGVLMFCSASDQGKFPDFNYPHASNPNCTFRIGAAKSTGTTSEFVGDVNELSFVFPGHDVVLSQQYDDVLDKSFQKFASHTGSSVATALAASLAALVLECVRLGILYTMESNLSELSVAIKREDLTKMKDKRAMEYALSSIGVNRQTDNKYIEVWDTFSDVARDLKQNEGVYLNQLEIIAGLARIFLRQGIKKRII